MVAQVVVQVVQCLLQHSALHRVLVAQVQVGGLAAHHLHGHQQAFQEAVGVALQAPAVFERTGFAFVDVDGQQRLGTQPRRVALHDAPLAPGREPCPTQTAQACVFQRVQHLLVRQRARCHRLRMGIATLAKASRKTHKIRSIQRFINKRWSLFFFMKTTVQHSLHPLAHGIGLGLGYGPLAHLHGRGLLAAAHAGGCLHADARSAVGTVFTQTGLQLLQQRQRAGHAARQAVAHPHRQVGATGHAIGQHLEVVVEGGHLHHLHGGQAHLVRQRHQQVAWQAVEAVVDGVQVLDEQAAVMPIQGRSAEECAHLAQRTGSGLAAFELVARLARRQRTDGGNVHGNDETRKVSSTLPPE